MYQGFFYFCLVWGLSRAIHYLSQNKMQFRTAEHSFLCEIERGVIHFAFPP